MVWKIPNKMFILNSSVYERFILSIKQNKLYRLQKKDIHKSGIILADAFHKDPVWTKVFDDFKTDAVQSFFQGPVRYGLKYGNAYAPSENLEGIAVWTAGSLADMTLWRIIRTGMIFSTSKLGMKKLKEMQTIFHPLEIARKNNMKGRDYIYFMVVGIASEHQGKGLGKKLFNEILHESYIAKLPIYLETATENNVKMYEKLGFKVIGKIIHPIINLPQWEMLREPENS